MDKQKYILFSERKKLADEYEEWVNKPLEDGSKIKDCALSVITFMSIKGFYKIPENSVLLTDDEDIQQFEWSKMIDKMGIFKVVDKLRKETAEKFAKMAKEEAFVDFMGEPIIRGSKIDEICKEITEGENG